MGSSCRNKSTLLSIEERMSMKLMLLMMMSRRKVDMRMFTKTNLLSELYREEGWRSTGSWKYIEIVNLR
jgi:hypothetical protein